MTSNSFERYSDDFSFSQVDDDDEEEEEEEEEPSPSSSLEGSEAERVLIDETNRLLLASGIVVKKILSLAELSRVASSIFVALFETVYHTRIDEVRRNPTTREDFEFNAQLVIDRLSEQINSDLSHITGALIVDGNFTALRNLVDIFSRIIYFSHGHHSTSTIESEESLSEDDFHHSAADHHQRPSFTTLDSISTKDSLPPKKLTRSRSQPIRRSITPSPRRSPNKSTMSSPRNRYEETVYRSLERAEGFLKSEIDLHEAALRRKSHLLWQQTRLRQENERKNRRAQSALKLRERDAFTRSEQAHRMRCESEEHVLLRKVYQALLREALRFKREERLQDQMFLKTKEKELADQLDSLQNIFRDRLACFEEEVQNERPLDSSAATLSQGRDAFFGLEKRYEELLDREQAWRQQCRDREFSKKRNGYKNLLSLLKAEKWSESLRTYS